MWAESKVINIWEKFFVFNSFFWTRVWSGGVPLLPPLNNVLMETLQLSLMRVFRKTRLTTESWTALGTYLSPQRCLFNDVSPIKLQRGLDKEFLLTCVDLYKPKFLLLSLSVSHSSTFSSFLPLYLSLPLSITSISLPLVHSSSSSHLLSQDQPSSTFISISHFCLAL